LILYSFLLHFCMVAIQPLSCNITINVLRIIVATGRRRRRITTCTDSSRLYDISILRLNSMNDKLPGSSSCLSEVWNCRARTTGRKWRGRSARLDSRTQLVLSADCSRRFTFAYIARNVNKSHRNTSYVRQKDKWHAWGVSEAFWLCPWLLFC